MTRELILDILKEKINGIKRMRPDKNSICKTWEK